jgi:hypothetical protein
MRWASCEAFSPTYKTTGSKKEKKMRHNPFLAGILSLLVPGLG